MGNEARENAKALDSAVSDLAFITGQQAVITRAKKSIASFKLRTGMPIGVMVTLRGPTDVGLPRQVVQRITGSCARLLGRIAQVVRRSR